MHNRLNGTSIGQQGHHNHNHFGRLAKPFQQSSPARTKGTPTAPTAIALPLAIMNGYIALAPFSSCQTRLIGAKLFRRGHWLWLLLFHAYSMPINLCFCKPPSFSPVSGVLPVLPVFPMSYFTHISVLAVVGKN